MLLHDMTLLSSHNTATLLKLTVTYGSLESAVLKREGLLLNNVTPGADTQHSLHKSCALHSANSVGSATYRDRNLIQIR